MVMIVQWLDVTITYTCLRGPATYVTPVQTKTNRHNLSIVQLGSIWLYGRLTYSWLDQITMPPL